ncbi:MAG: molybdenum cofactor biosynthesis protein MoaE [Candidatus Omnitrophica bacterium]|nr:molybdenum cofactor biosynthesis protein MoaE [Candidatus Omnitrophota bacterium]
MTSDKQQVTSQTSYLTWEPIDVEVWHRLAIDQQDGASVEFLGIVRGLEDGRPIPWLDYDAYAPMAERVITQLIETARRRWPVHEVYVRHRVGRVPVGEVAVLIGVHAPHRDEAFAACRFLIDGIKQDAPIWKMHGHPAH